MMSLSAEAPLQPFSGFLNENERAKMGGNVEFDDFAHDGKFPVIDYESPELMQQLHDAAREFGFFQLTNHGVDLETIRQMQAKALDLFALPLEQKMAIKSASDRDKIGYGYGGPGGRFWLEAFETYDDSAMIHDFSQKLWPDAPDAALKFRETVEKYNASMRTLGQGLTRYLGTAIGMNPDAMFDCCSRERMHLRINYYPTCPDPSATLGKAPHYDKHFITLLHQDLVGGLQVLKDGKWLGLKPRKDAIIVNIGKALEVFSNGVYVGMKHRVVTNSNSARMSMVYLICPRPDCYLDAPEEIIDQEHPRKFRSFTYGEMLKEIDRVRNVDLSKSYLSSFEL